MIPEKSFESATPKKVNSANLRPGKIYLKIETPGKNHNQGTPVHSTWWKYSTLWKFSLYFVYIFRTGWNFLI